MLARDGHVVMIHGNLGRDPDLQHLPSGTPVVNFPVASNRKWKDRDGEQHQETIWFRVSVFGPQAENINRYLSKGRGVIVEGRMRPDDNGNPRIWTGNDGESRASFEVVGLGVRFLSGRNGGSGEKAPDVEEEEDDEIPF